MLTGLIDINFLMLILLLGSGNEQTDIKDGSTIVNFIKFPQYTNSRLVKLRGYAPPDSTVVIEGGANAKTLAITNEWGLFITCVELKENERNSISAYAITTKKEETLPIEIVIVHDNINPTIPYITSIPKYVDDIPYTITGTGEPDSNIIIKIGEKEFVTTADLSGNFLMSDLPLSSEQPNDITIYSIDRAGNRSSNLEMKISLKHKFDYSKTKLAGGILFLYHIYPQSDYFNVAEHNSLFNENDFNGPGLTLQFKYRLFKSSSITIEGGTYNSNYSSGDLPSIKTRFENYYLTTGIEFNYFKKNFITFAGPSAGIYFLNRNISLEDMPVEKDKFFAPGAGIRTGIGYQIIYGIVVTLQYSFFYSPIFYANEFKDTLDIGGHFINLGLLRYW